MTGLASWPRKVLERVRGRPATFARDLAALDELLHADPTARVERYLYGDLPLRLVFADPVAREWYGRDWDPIELDEIALLRRGKLEPGARVFDIGAHQCVVAMALADAVGPSGSVVALEANAHNARIARMNRALNRVAQLEVLHAAGADRSGPITMLDFVNTQVTTDGSGVVVDGHSVDALAQTYGLPDVLFIDVEGFEGKVLSGATGTLARRPDCFVEVHVGCGLEKFGDTVDSILAYFPDDAYERFVAAESDHRFVPYAGPCDILRERFYLVAMARR